MKTIKWSEADPTDLEQSIAEVLEQGGLVCLPCQGKYRLFADLTNVDAVMHLMQSKSRVRRASPALVFIDDEARLRQVAEEINPVALRLARALWPKALTIRVRPHPDLPSKVLKQLGGSKSRIGVRVPGDPFICALVKRVDRPLLVSSANKEDKAGDGSPAQIRKSFSAHVDLFLDRGDLAPEPPSTVVEVQDGQVIVDRAGSIPAAELTSASAAPESQP